MVIVEDRHGRVGVQCPVVVVERLGLGEDVVGIVVRVILGVFQTVRVDHRRLELVNRGSPLGLEGGDGGLLLDCTRRHFV